MPKFDAIILAAGRSTRMRSALPKVLHPVCGRPVVSYAVTAAMEAGANGIVLVISGGMEGATLRGRPNREGTEALPYDNIEAEALPYDNIEAEALPYGNMEEVLTGGHGGPPLRIEIRYAVQKQPLGTADAVRAAKDAIDRGAEYVLIIPGDVPLVRAETLRSLMDETLKKGAVLGVLTVEMNDPASYGRIIRNSEGFVTSIREARDAAPAELKIREINSSIYFAKTDWLFAAIGEIAPKNAQGEFYLTDIVGIASGTGRPIVAVKCADEAEIMGVNTRKELAMANRKMRGEILEKLMAEGVGILDEGCTYIDDGVKIGADTTVWPCSFILGKTTIGKACTIENGVSIKDSTIGDNVHIRSGSVIEGATVASNAIVGPMARLRPGAVLEEETRVGNFVEVKKSTLKKGAKANHLSYIGDAVVGERTNVGCGMITCNYDGKEKHKTVIGKDVLIGSDVQFVAPVTIGDNAVIGAGSTITEDVPENSLAIARQRQVTKKNWKK